MLKGYLKIALRNFRKNSIPSIINLTGLSVAIACAIVVFLFLERQYTMDRFHEGGKRIFLVENFLDRGNDQELWGVTPAPLADAIAVDIPGVERVARVDGSSAVFRVGDLVLEEGVWFADESFLEMFSFELRAGRADVLEDPGAIVLSDAAATRFFGQEDAIGREISLTFGGDTARIFRVGAVAAAFPGKSSFRFNALIHWDRQQDLDIDASNWARFTDATFVELRSPDDATVVSQQLQQYRAPQNAANQNWKVSEFLLANLYDLSLETPDVFGDISSGSHPTAILVLGLVAVFLVMLSCFNYTNLSIAGASRRLKEIGVRKVVGGSRQQLVAQFMSENVVLCLIALGLGYILAWTLFIPGFNNLFNFVGGNVSLTDAGGANLLLFLAGLLLLTGLVSGAYPAFFIASFRPTAIFRGQQAIGKGNLLTRSLLTLQFVLAFLTMIMGVVLALNADYQNERDWGYDGEHQYVVFVPDFQRFDLLEGEISALPQVTSMVGSQNHFARSWNSSVLDIDGEKSEAVRFDVGPGYLQQFGIRMLAGRFLSDNEVSAPSRDVVVNETFARTRGWSAQEAVGRDFRVDSLSHSIVGVAQDFMYSSFYNPIEPAFLRLTSPDNYRYLSVAVAPESGARTAEEIQEIWKRHFPDEAFYGFFQDTVFDDMYLENVKIKKLFNFIAGIALFIACLGLFGLAVQNVIRRMKEINIRKVMGASVAHIARTVNTGFLVLILIAAVIATPLGYVAMTALLNSVYPDPVPIGPFPFILSFSLVFLAALLTVSTQVMRVASNSPAQVLRSE